MVRSNDEMVSDEKVLAATGQSREHWFALLDSQNAQAWSHTQMAAHLVENGVDAWWAQGITVAYEQARGLRVPGQNADGSFDASISKTLPVTVGELWPLLVDDEGRARWLGPGFELAGETPGTSVRLRDGEGHRVALSFYGSAPAGAAVSKTRLQVQVLGLPDADAVASAKAEWKAALARLQELLKA